MSRFHIAEIDLVRLFAALAVLLFHLSWQNPLLPNAAPWGWVGVEIFFVISGLVIGQSAFHSSAPGFLASRFFRLVPTAVICALFSQLILRWIPAAGFADRGIWVFQDLQAFIGSLILIYPVHSASAYWTLPIEIAFYALIFVFLVAGKMDQLGRFLVLMTAVSALYLHLLLANIIFFPEIGWLDFGFGLKNMLLVRHMPFFVLGYLIYRRRIAGEHGTTGHAALAIGSLYLCGLEIVIRASGLIPGFHYVTGLMPLAAMALAMFLISVFFIYKTAGGEWRFVGRGRFSGLVKFCGLITYPVYLLHEVTGGAVLFLASKTGAPEGIGLIAAVLAVAGLAAVVVALEQWLDLRSRFGKLRFPPVQGARH